MSDRELILTIAQLARSSPRSWDEFLAHYRVHCNETIEQVITSPLENLPVAQGRARHATETLRLFEGAIQAAERDAARKSK